MVVAIQQPHIHPLVWQSQHTKPAQIISRRDTMTVHTSNIKSSICRQNTKTRIYHLPPKSMICSWQLAVGCHNELCSAIILIDSSRFNSQRSAISDLVVVCQSYWPDPCEMGLKIPEVHCVFAHHTCSQKIPLCHFTKSSRFFDSIFCTL